MEVKEFNIKGRKNLQLSVMTVKDDVPTKGVVQIFHGMGEHKNRYIPFAKYLAKEGYVVIAHDHRKHGHSVEKETDLGIFVKGDVWDDIITDCYIVTGHIFKEYPRLPITVLGHSMGSIIAREFLGRYSDVASKAIIMGTLPEIKMGKAIAPIMISNILNLFNFKNKPSNFLSELLNKPLMKDFDTPRTKFDWLTFDENQVDKYIEDPLCGYAYTPIFYKEFFKAIVRVNTSDSIFEGKDIPILFVAGKNDPVGEYGSGVKEIRELYSGHGFLNLTLKLFEDQRHEILNEKKNKEVYKYILDWLNK